MDKMMEIAGMALVLFCSACSAVSFAETVMQRKRRKKERSALKKALFVYGMNGPDGSLADAFLRDADGMAMDDRGSIPRRKEPDFTYHDYFNGIRK